MRCKVLLFDDPQSVTPEQLEARIPLLPAWRREYALSYRFLIDRVTCCEAYLLLKQGLRDGFGIDCDPSFAFLKNGKPVLRDMPGIHFNLSHCRKGVLCVIADEPVGCDIEAVPEVLDMDLCRHCFSLEETGLITRSASPEIEFTRWWTMKEAALKLTGEGLTDDMRPLFGNDTYRGLEFEARLCAEKRYVYTVCRRKTSGNP